MIYEYAYITYMNAYCTYIVGLLLDWQDVVAQDHPKHIEKPEQPLQQQSDSYSFAPSLLLQALARPHAHWDHTLRRSWPFMAFPVTHRLVATFPRAVDFIELLL